MGLNGSLRAGDPPSPTSPGKQDQKCTDSVSKPPALPPPHPFPQGRGVSTRTSYKVCADLRCRPTHCPIGASWSAAPPPCLRGERQRTKTQRNTRAPRGPAMARAPTKGQHGGPNGEPTPANEPGSEYCPPGVEVAIQMVSQNIGRVNWVRRAPVPARRCGTSRSASSSAPGTSSTSRCTTPMTAPRTSSAPPSAPRSTPLDTSLHTRRSTLRVADCGSKRLRESCNTIQGDLVAPWPWPPLPTPNPRRTLTHRLSPYPWI